MLIAAGFACNRFDTWASRPARFNSHRWKATRTYTSTWNWRNRMAEDVVDRVIRRGMSRKQVISLLGEPDLDQKPEAGDNIPTESLSYTTLEKDDWGNTQLFLGITIEISAEGKVTRADMSSSGD
jgi:hypothetical protein